MDKEKERRIEECKSSQVTMSDDKAAVLEEMARKVIRLSLVLYICSGIVLGGRCECISVIVNSYYCAPVQF